ncbi:protein zwilch homolog isoform X1 [Chelonoidis abingdonii]|uniref:protein zwilch homolog isoform X1 n=1 Tax=Chelonoidis abingdonii TaxID=106734 RepID=UPI0013F24395|nr:protein zwilch homolog isoform X1 [Chelonoidis abingdonii]
MGSHRHQAALRLYDCLLQVYNEGNKGIPKDPFPFEADVQVHLIGEGCRSPLESFWNGNSMIFIMQKAGHAERTDKMEESQRDDATYILEFTPQKGSGPVALSVTRGKQLISLYTLAQNPNMTHLKISKPVVLPPLWVRCDSSDPEHTCWLGAEPLKNGNKITGISFHVVTCNGPTADKTCFANLEDLKKAHKFRHRSSIVATKGFAQYELIRSTTLEDTVVESESNIYVDITWNIVDKILQTPPLTAAATLNIRLESGDPRSPVFQLHRELQFLLVLAEGLKTGVTDWPEPLVAESAVELVKELLNDLKNKLDGFNTSVHKNDAEKVQCDSAAVDSSIKSLFNERGDLDFAEQLWCKMRRSVASYQDLVECFTLIIKSLEYGEIQPWIHQGSSSLLSKLIQQSYHGAMEAISLSGVTPIQMLLEIGLDKMKKDYVSCFIGQELATLTYLDYFISTSVELQEQVHRIQKLHHMLEILVSCTVFLHFKHENLFPLMQSCIKYYKENPLNEKHVFQLPIRPAVVNKFYQNDHTQIWRVEINSGHGQKEVKTVWQLSTSPPVEHMTSNNLELLCDTTVNGNTEESMYFITMANCSQVHFA